MGGILRRRSRAHGARPRARRARSLHDDAKPAGRLRHRARRRRHRRGFPRARGRGARRSERARGRGRAWRRSARRHDVCHARTLQHAWPRAALRGCRARGRDRARRCRDGRPQPAQSGRRAAAARRGDCRRARIARRPGARPQSRLPVDPGTRPSVGARQAGDQPRRTNRAHRRARVSGSPGPRRAPTAMHGAPAPARSSPASAPCCRTTRG